MELDASGLRCPLPIVRLTQAIGRLEPGNEIQVLADDPAFTPDVQAWCRKTGNTLVSTSEQGKDVTVVVRKEG